MTRIDTMQKVTPFLWYDGTAEDAMRFYAKIFPKSKVTGRTPGPDGKVLVVSAVIAGQPVMALNGGPHYKINEAFSFYVDCKDQKEVDKYWKKLLAGGGEVQMCGWIKDRYGVSWQIIPRALPKLMGDKDPEKAGRVMQAMLKMRKIDVKKLEKAHAGK